MSDACAKLNATVRLALVNTTNETLVFMDILREVLNVLHRLSLSLVSSSKAIQTQALERDLEFSMHKRWAS